MKHIWKENETEFIIKNYPSNGLKFCSEKLDIDSSKIRSKILRLKIKLNNLDKTDISIFKNIKTKEAAYIIGILWSDGCISNTHRNYNIKLESNFNDMNNIENIIMKTGKWNKHIRKRKIKNNIINYSICYYIGFKKLYNIFKQYDLDKKSTISPSKILDSIPDELKHYFFLGIIDGDGCFYINKKQYVYQFSITSTFNQDWKYMIDLCEYLNIDKYSINRIKNINKKNNKENKYSQFRICRKNDIKILGEYIYQNFDDDKLGLLRKNIKYKECLK